MQATLAHLPTLGGHLLGLSLAAVVVLGPLPICCWLARGARRGPPERGSAAEAVLVASAAWAVLQTSVGLLLGLLGGFTLRGLLLFESALFLAGIPLAGWRDLAPLRGAPGRPLRRAEKLVLLGVAVVGLTLLWKILTEPIRDYDSLAYHLPAMARWYQQGRFVPFTQFDQIGRYPYGWETLCALMLFPFGEDWMVALPNVLAWGILGTAVYLVSRALDASRAAALVFAGLLLTLPLVIENVNTMHVDLALAAFFAAGAHYAVSFHRRRSLRDLGMLGGCLGMLCGIKATGPVYGLLAALMLGGSALFSKPPGTAGEAGPGPATRGLWMLAAAAFFSLPGGFWYLRNLADLGNPLGLVQVKLGPLLVFPGTIAPGELERTTLASLFDAGRWAHWKILLSEMRELLGEPAAAMALQVMVWPLAFVAGGERRTRQLLAVAAMAALTAVIYWHTPYTGDNGSHGWWITPWIGQAFRYGLPAVASLAVAAAIAATAVRTPAALLAAAMLLCAGLAVARSPGVAIVAAALTAAAFLAARGALRPRGWRGPGLRSARRSVVVALVALLALAASWGARGIRNERRGRMLGGIVGRLDRETRAGDGIGYLLDPQSYLLYGSRIDRRVVHVPLRGGDLRGWLEELRRNDIAWLALGPAPIGEEDELRWIERCGRVFQPVFGIDPRRETVLYRVVDLGPEVSGAAAPCFERAASQPGRPALPGAPADPARQPRP